MVRRLPKLCGADIELANFILGVDRPDGTCPAASRALLREFCGSPGHRAARNGKRAKVLVHPARPGGGGEFVEAEHGGFDERDWGRKYLPSNGGCVYIDLDHLEVCLPEVLSAHDFVACWHAMLRLTREALDAANRRQRRGRRIHVLANNSDGRGNSYGSHLNFLITRTAWESIFRRKIHHMLFLASYQVSSIIFTGQGKVGSENGAPPVDYQLSQRADFFERLTGIHTTFSRPIVNSRDEALCGSAWRGDGDDVAVTRQMARLHVIFYDSTLSHVTNLLKVGVMQIILAMIEAERVSPTLMLESPLDALVRWSHDPTLTARARTCASKKLSAVELQLLFLEEARRFARRGGCDGIVPGAGEILDLWEDTLLKLRARDLPALAGRLDWVLKLSVLRNLMAQRPDLHWSSPEVKHLDQIFSSLDPEEGIFWSLERGLMEPVVGETEIERFRHEPPADTRAWGRAMLLRWAGPDRVDDLNWDYIRFRVPSGRHSVSVRTLNLANPLGYTRAEMAAALHGLPPLDGLGKERAGTSARASVTDREEDETHEHT